MNSSETKMGVLSGISFSMIGQVQSSILQTILLAALGAAVSFLVSKILQLLFRQD
ncbi:hypothetical protein [Pedobacter mendelii]|uniref:Uncharacterized protein n=1 Tax=Pedobacter mendelii TaxID=1908240 RepID=A0ABQ2BPH2_9SPHI|nr:hypothetical protein [Pedobacter mendelii]GGI28397.1 hypothetical protein GCM10008119_32440 [Pedobacter mendelii]